MKSKLLFYFSNFLAVQTKHQDGGQNEEAVITLESFIRAIATTIFPPRLMTLA